MIYTQRIFWSQASCPERRATLLELLQRHRGVCEEISWFTENDGMDWRYVPAAEVEERARLMENVLQETAAAGFTPVVNVLNSMGHSDEGGDAAPALPWQGFVGRNGAVSRHCSCPAQPEFLDYLRYKYRSYALPQTRLVWIDDDIRLNNHAPADWGCFCPSCLRDFETSTGRQWSRETLAAALDEEPAVRNAWAARNDSIMVALLDACTQGIRAGNPQTEVGFMLCDVAELADWRSGYERWTAAQQTAATQNEERSLWLRPGGGFWSGDRPLEMLEKVHRVSNTVDSAPPGARTTYELENYPYVQGQKSAHLTGLECLLAILGSRLNGFMFNVLDAGGNDATAFEPWLEQLEAWRPLWDQASQLVSGTTPAGWLPYSSKRHFPNAMSLPANQARRAAYAAPLAWQRTGIPLTGFLSGARGYLLSEEATHGLNRDEMLAVLKRPLIMDAGAAKRFLDAGLGPKIGLRSLTTFTEGVYERFTGHQLNGSAAGYNRSATLRYFGATSWALEPEADTEILSELLDYTGHELGAALTFRPGRPENDEAPVAVVGHFPWMHLLSPQRVQQLQNLASAMVPTCPPLGGPGIVQWHRRDKAGGPIVVLYNAGQDPAPIHLGSSPWRSLLQHGDVREGAGPGQSLILGGSGLVVLQLLGSGTNLVV